MKNTGRASLETADRTQCVDVFLRPDGSFGFEHYRADLDGARRWQSLNKFSHLIFATGDEALRGAKQGLPCLDQQGGWRW